MARVLDLFIGGCIGAILTIIILAPNINFKTKSKPINLLVDKWDASEYYSEAPNCTSSRLTIFRRRTSNSFWDTTDNIIDNIELKLKNYTDEKCVEEE